MDSIHTQETQRLARAAYGSMKQAQNGGFSKAKFTPEEDARLTYLVASFGSDDWKKVAECMPLRNARQCRDRYKNYLNPSLDRSAWTPQEDARLIEEVSNHGTKWNTIARSFCNRSDISLRNRWHQLERRLRRGESTTDDYPPTPAFQGPIPSTEEPTLAPVDVEVAPRPWTPFEVFDTHYGVFDDPFEAWNSTC
jgi:hypothetical protein